MAVDVTAVEDAIRDWILVVIPTATVIFAYEDGAKPSRPYIAINFLNMIRVGRDAQVQPDAADNQETAGNREIIISLNAFGTSRAETFQVLDQLATSLQKTFILDGLQANNVSFMRAAGGIIDLTEKLETEHEHRASIDLIFSVQSVEVDAVDVIEKANLDSTYLDEASNTILAETINVNP